MTYRPKFPTQLNRHGLLIRDYIRDYTKVQEEPHVHCLGPPDKANDRSSYNLLMT